MKDEEMAKEWVANKADKGNFDLEQFGQAYFSESSMKQAFLAGLKAGRPKWHKVADGDLPEYGVEVLDKDGDKVIYNAGESQGWMAYSEYCGRYVEVDAPVAWCEVPKYTEE